MVDHVGGFKHNPINGEIELLDAAGWAAAAAASAAEAAVSAEEAAAYAASALVYRGDAIAARDAAEAWVLIAKDWAIKMDGPVEATSYSSKYNATLAATSYADTLAVYQSFTDSYLGAYASAPSLTPNGSVLAEGMLYFDTTEKKLKIFSAGLWRLIEGTGGTNQITDYEFSSDGITWASFSDDETNYMRFRQYDSDVDPDLTGVPWTVVSFGSAQLTSVNDLPVGSLSNVELQFSPDKLTWGNSYNAGDVWARVRISTVGDTGYTEPNPPPSTYASWSTTLTRGFSFANVYSEAYQTLAASTAVSAQQFNTGKHYWEVELTSFAFHSNKESDYNGIMQVGLWNGSAPQLSKVAYASGVAGVSDGWYDVSDGKVLGAFPLISEDFFNDGTTGVAGVTWAAANAYIPSATPTARSASTLLQALAWLPGRDNIAVNANGAIVNNGAIIANQATTGLPTWTEGAVVQVALDMDTGKVWFGVDNTWYGDPAAGTGGHAIDATQALRLAFCGGVNLSQVSLPAAATYTAPAGFTFYVAGTAVDPGDLTGEILEPLLDWDISTWAAEGAGLAAGGGLKTIDIKNHPDGSWTTGPLSGNPCNVLVPWGDDGNSPFTLIAKVVGDPSIEGITTGKHYAECILRHSILLPTEFLAETSITFGSPTTWAVRGANTQGNRFGVVNELSTVVQGELGASTGQWALEPYQANLYAQSGTPIAPDVPTHNPPHFVGILLDADAKKIWFFRNGREIPTLNGGMYPGGGISISGTSFWFAGSHRRYDATVTPDLVSNHALPARITYMPQIDTSGINFVQSLPSALYDQNSIVGVPDPTMVRNTNLNTYGVWLETDPVTGAARKFKWTTTSSTYADKPVPFGPAFNGTQKVYFEYNNGEGADTWPSSIGFLSGEAAACGTSRTNANSYGFIDSVLTSSGGSFRVQNFHTGGEYTTYSAWYPGTVPGDGSTHGFLWDRPNQMAFTWISPDGNPANGVWYPADPNVSPLGGWDTSLIDLEDDWTPGFFTRNNTTWSTAFNATPICDTVPADAINLGAGPPVSDGWTYWQFEHGASLWQGAGAPSATIGYDGDTYINLTTGELFKKQSGSWGTSVAELAFAKEAGRGFLELVTESTVARTVQLTDEGDYIRCTNAAATTVTIDPEGTTAYPDLFAVHVRAVGAGGVTIAPGSGVTINGKVSVPQNEAVTLIKVGTNEWDSIG